LMASHVGIAGNLGGHSRKGFALVGDCYDEIPSQFDTLSAQPTSDHAPVDTGIAKNVRMAADASSVRFLPKLSILNVEFIAFWR
jgi:hypothetical protein